MTSRERVLRTLQHQEPDRVPLDLGSEVTSIHKIAHRNLKEHLGLEDGEEIITDQVQQVVKPDERILRRFDIDVRHIALRSAVPWRKIGEGLYRDEWGIVYREQSGYCEMIGYPLAEIDDVKGLEAYPWPDPHDRRRFEGLEEEARDLHDNTEYALMFGGFNESFFGLPSWLVGPERFYTDLIIDEDFINALLDHLEDFFLKLADEALNRVGSLIQLVKLADDIGTQSGPLLSPDLYRKLIKPRQKRLYARIKEKTDAKLFLHACGSVYPFMEDFIDNGIDALNPVQFSATDMQPERLKREFGDRLTFWGAGCDTQRVLPFGTPEEVEQEVRTRIDQFAPGGGFVFSAVHNIQYDVPPQNIVTMYDTARTYGTYPCECGMRNAECGMKDLA